MDIEMFWLYVWSGNDFAFNVNTRVSPDGKSIAYCDVVEWPSRNGGSLRDIGRVPG